MNGTAIISPIAIWKVEKKNFSNLRFEYNETEAIGTCPQKKAHPEIREEKGSPFEVAHFTGRPLGRYERVKSVSAYIFFGDIQKKGK